MAWRFPMRPRPARAMGRVRSGMLGGGEGGGKGSEGGMVVVEVLGEGGTRVLRGLFA